MLEKIKTRKLVMLHTNKSHIRNQHGRFSGNRYAYCHIYHGEILNFKCLTPFLYNFDLPNQVRYNVHCLPHNP